MLETGAVPEKLRKTVEHLPRFTGLKPHVPYEAAIIVGQTQMIAQNLRNQDGVVICC